MRKPLILLAAANLSGCGTLMEPPKHVTNQWGGPHISLLLEGGLGHIEYDCATGTIDSPLVPGRDGSFTAIGTHRPGSGGPVRVGQIFTSHRATYSGTLVKDQMTLTAQLEDGTVIGPFSLVRGAEGQLMRCL
jgi:hypothetical protein